MICTYGDPACGYSKTCDLCAEDGRVDRRRWIQQSAQQATQAAAKKTRVNDMMAGAKITALTATLVPLLVKKLQGTPAGKSAGKFVGDLLSAIKHGNYRVVKIGDESIFSETISSETPAKTAEELQAEIARLSEELKRLQTSPNNGVPPPSSTPEKKPPEANS